MGLKDAKQTLLLLRSIQLGSELLHFRLTVQRLLPGRGMTGDGEVKLWDGNDTEKYRDLLASRYGSDLLHFRLMGQSLLPHRGMGKSSCGT